MTLNFKNFKVVLVGLLLSVVAACQTSTTFQTITTSASQNNFAYGPIYSIGQANHQFTVVYKDNGGSTCTTPRDANPGGLLTDPVVEIIGKYDQSTSGVLSLPYFINNSVNGSSSTFRGSRTFTTTSIAPFLYIQFQNHNWTNCRAEIYYGGSLTGTVQNQPLQNSPGYPATTYSYNNLSTVTSDVVTGTPTIIFSPRNAFYKMEIWSIVVSNSTAGANTYVISEILSDGSTGLPLYTFTLPASTTITLGQETGPWISSFIGSTNFSVTATGTAGTSRFIVSGRSI